MGMHNMVKIDTIVNEIVRNYHNTPNDLLDRYNLSPLVLRAPPPPTDR